VTDLGTTAGLECIDGVVGSLLTISSSSSDIRSIVSMASRVETTSFVDDPGDTKLFSVRCQHN
jgi:hypothetical protein